MDPQDTATGGWTLAMRVDGSQETFQYESPLWTNSAPYPAVGASPDYGFVEGKLPSFWQVGFQQIALEFRRTNASPLRVIFINARAQQASLKDYFASAAKDITPGVLSRKADWLGLVPNSVLQPLLNKEYLNYERPDGKLRLRLGFIANNDLVLGEVNSFIGVGGGGTGGLPGENPRVLRPQAAGNYCDDAGGSPGCNRFARDAWVFVYVK
jgi:hypothetical protein